MKSTAHYYLICFYLFLSVYIPGAGGIESPSAIWLIALPLVALLVLSTRSAFYWLIIILTTLGAFCFFPTQLVFGAIHPPTVWYFISYVTLFSMVYCIIFAFRREVTRKNYEFEKVNQLLRSNQMELQAAKTAALARSQKLTYYMDQLLEVHRMEELHTGSLQYAIDAIQHFLMKVMNLQSVATWTLRSAECALEQIGSLHAEGHLQQPVKISKKDFPEIFDLLESGAIVTTLPSFTFNESNAELTSICCPYFVNGKFEGFFQCVAMNYRWSAEDVMFIRAISDALPLAFKSHVRKEQQLLLEKQQFEIRQLNESLEQKVRARTTELQLRNKQLTDLSFINAHEIRGPVCRIMGLQNLLNQTTEPEEISLLNRYMSVTINELDLITKKTSAQLNQIV